MDEHIFKICSEINDLLTDSKEKEAREELIKLLDYHKTNQINYMPIVNHLIRETGLYPYIQTDTASWEDKFVCEAFKVNTGDKEEETLHREQSLLLRKLLEGKNIAVSAPTSFGKSFVIDAFIALKNPKNVVIIVPTIALADETRRRINKKFSTKYKIITTSDVEISDKNIFIFPQERAISYINKLDSIDILIIDEFYKASSRYDDRAPVLLKAILKLGKKARQKYFLAPNISEISPNIFTEDMQFEYKLDFNTVYLNRHNLYQEIGKDEILKGEKLLEILNSKQTKSLIYAASYPQIEKVSNVLNENLPIITDRQLLNDFSEWLTINYDTNWKLTNLIRRGVGIHNGQIHRSLSQIQVKLFEKKENGLDNIVSTSSIIEGVNTSAENIIIWRNKRSGGNAKLDVFTYKNIIGRGGRMFKHFIGQIYLLESPPEETNVQLDIDFPDTILGDIDEREFGEKLTTEQISKIIDYKRDMSSIIGEEAFKHILKDNMLQNNTDIVKGIAQDMKNKPDGWNGLSHLNSEDPDDWTQLLRKIKYLTPGEWGYGAYYVQHNKFVSFVQCIAYNWTRSIPEMLDELDEYEINIEQFFKLERIVSFKLSALLNDVNVLQKEILTNMHTDISPFIYKVSHAFLPKLVYELEEYGLPRMVSKKIQNAGLINLEDSRTPIHNAINQFNQIGLENIKQRIPNLHPFESYILDYFYDGIKSE
jgi:hypothetical protein